MVEEEQTRTSEMQKGVRGGIKAYLWPVLYEGRPFSSSSSEVKLELVHHDLDAPY